METNHDTDSKAAALKALSAAVRELASATVMMRRAGMPNWATERVQAWALEIRTMRVSAEHMGGDVAEEVRLPGTT